MALRRPCIFFSSLHICRRWGQSTSYNVAHPTCGHKGSTHLSPVHAYEFLSRCRFSTPTPRQPMVELFVLTSSRFPLRKSEEKFTPAESRTHKFRLSGRMLYPLVHGGSPSIVFRCMMIVLHLTVRLFRMRLCVWIFCCRRVRVSSLGVF